MLQTTKMFVNYSGSVAQFKEAGLETIYNKSIVFIGNGEAVYTHGKYYGDVKDALNALTATVNGLKYFSGIKVDGSDQTAVASGKDGVITFSATNPAEVAVDINSKGVAIGLSAEFVNKVNKVISDLADEITARTNADNSIKSSLGNATDEANAEGSVYARIAQIKSDINDMTGGNGSINDQIVAAIDKLDVAATEGDYVSKISQVDGKIVAETGTFNFDTKGAAANALQDAKDYADGLKTAIEAGYAAADASTLQSAKSYADGLASNYDAAGAAAGALNDAKDYTDEKIAEVNEAATTLTNRVKANEDALTLLNGSETEDGSVANTVKEAINDWANSVTADNTTVDTFKELIDYAATHSSEYSELAGVVQGHTTAINTLKGDADTAGSVAKAVKDAVDAEAAIARAAEAKNASDIKKISDDYLKAADKTELSGAIAAEKSRAEGIEGGLDTRLAAVEGDYLKTVDKTELQGNINTLSQTVADNKTAAETGISEAKAAAQAAATKAQANADAIAAMDFTSGNGFVTSVSQVDGKVSATVAQSISAEKITVTDTADHFPAEVTTVEAALAALAEMWTWEEK